VAVATTLLGDPVRRKSGRLWWPCPLHDDDDPSFAIRPGRSRWDCFSQCGHGDAADLVMRVRGVGFPEAVLFLAERAGELAQDRPASGLPEQPPGLLLPEAEELVRDAIARLWSPEGRAALRYLQQHRGLQLATIRHARLGWTPKADGVPWEPPGIVVPEFDGDRLTLVKIRVPDSWIMRFPEDRRPGKYLTAFRDRPTIYPGAGVIRPGDPLIIVEGAFDALLLQQELDGLAGVITAGSATDRARGRARAILVFCSELYLATDNDGAGDKAAALWPTRAIRVSPPFKDWTACFQAGVDLRRWWEERLLLERFLTRLRARGIRLDGQVVHPQIVVGTVTGRVTYTGPPLQTMPEIERLCRLAPTTESRVWVKADYGQIEPRVLLEILRRRGAIAWEAGGDLYRTLASDEIDRDVVKVAVNKLINGGSPPAGAVGRLAEFIAAHGDYRAELASIAETEGGVETLAGRRIPLAQDEPNHGGKAVNRVVQGTAADIFHRGMLRVGDAIAAQGLPADVGFLLFDEVWLECDPAVARIVAQVVVIELERAALSLGVMVPVRLKVELAESGDPYDAEERAAVLEFDGELGKEVAERAAGLG
jgi:hypothetical protein